jgi:hypothetical protein
MRSAQQSLKSRAELVAQHIIYRRARNPDPHLRSSPPTGRGEDTPPALPAPSRRVSFPRTTVVIRLCHNIHHDCHNRSRRHPHLGSGKSNPSEPIVRRQISPLRSCDRIAPPARSLNHAHQPGGRNGRESKMSTKFADQPIFRFRTMFPLRRASQRGYLL